jgi:protein disulfide-isomerase
MKHLVFLMVAIAACAVLAKTSTPEGWTDDYDAALKRAAAENKLVLADFSGSDWCGCCKKLDKEVFDTEEFRKGATNEYVLLMVDTPQDQELLSEKAKKQNPKLVEKYRVEGFPTVLVLDAKGGVVFQGGYEQGGPKKYLKMLRRGAKKAPDIAKYIKPIEDVLNKYDADMQKDSEAMKERLEKEFPAPKLEVPSARNARMKKMKTRGGEIFFGEIFAKYEPLYDKAFAEAKAMKVPPHLELKKLELISRQEQSFLSMKMAKLRFEAEQNGYLDEDDSDEDDGEEDDDVDEDGEPVPNDGHWHGIAYAESWAACVQTNAALPTAWKYFTEQFRPYVRRQLLPADEKAFAKETAALVDGIARTLWTPHNTSYVTWSLGADFRLAQSLRDRGCSNLTVRALATAGDFDAHMKRHGSIWPKGKESDVYRGVAAELLDKGASPLLRWLYVRRIGEKIVNCGTPDKDMVDGLKERPQDLRVVYNLIGSPECAKAADPWFGLMAEAKAENSAAWKCRGGGYAGKVTEEGWKGFYEHLGKATNLMERAYALHPELPETAALMMEVKAPIDEDAMNTWFDRVLALEVDNPDAWQTLMFYSLPRWWGSVQDLRDLSAILATITREDASGLRYLSAQTLGTAAIEADAKDPSAFFRDPELRSRYLSALRPLVDGEGVDDETAGCARKGIVDRFWDVGEYEEAGKAYRELIASAPVRFSLPGDH